MTTTTNEFPITILSTSILSLLYAKQSLDVINHRSSAKIALGTIGKDNNQDGELLKKTRIHGNSSEYIPIMMLLLGMMEGIQYYPSFVVVAWSFIIITGRLAHWYGLFFSNIRFRVVGMQMTLNPIIFISIMNIISLFYI